jgi:hypothetical protein
MHLRYLGEKKMSNKQETPVSWLVEQLHIAIVPKEILVLEALQMESQKQQKYDEMLGMLEAILEAQESGEVFHSYKIEQLIKGVKEL